MTVTEIEQLGSTAEVAVWLKRQLMDHKADPQQKQAELFQAAGIRLMELGDHISAEEYLNQAIDAYDACGNPDCTVDCQLQVARSYLKRNNFTTCLHLAKAALEQARALNYQPGIANSLLNAGNSCWRLGQLEEAREHLESARKLFFQLGDHELVADCDLSLGTVAALSQDYNTAENTYLSALAYFQQAGAKQLEYRTLNNLAGVMFQRFDFIKARQYLEHCRKLLTDKRGSLRLNIYYNLGLLDVHEGKLGSARKNLNRALMLAREESSNEVEAKVLLNLGLTSLYAHELDEAVNYLDLAALRAQGRQQTQRPVALIRCIIQLAAGQLSAKAKLPEPADQIDSEVLWQAIPALEFIQMEAAAGKLELSEAIRELAKQWATAMRRALDAKGEPQPS